LSSPDVVGRDAELDLLRSALADLRDGRGGAVFVVGEPGLGKTRLVRELTRIATAATVTVVQGRATLPSVPFRPLSEALFSALRHSGVPDDPELVPYRHALSRLVPEWRAQRLPGVDDSLVVLAEAVLRLLRRLGRDTGCLAVFDDLHDADADTLAVVDYLVDNLTDEPVLLVGTVRPDPGRTVDLVRAARRRGVATVIELSYLDDKDVGRLVAGCLGVRPDTLPAEVVGRVRRAAEGNPFYVEELLAGMLSEGDLVRSAAGWRSAGRGRRGVPATVLASVTARVERLGPAGLRVLRSAAVFGQHFPASLVGVVADVADDHLLVVLRSGVDSRLIAVADDGGYSFRHALTLEALRAGLLPQERVALAHRAAEAIEAAHPDLPDDWCLVAGEMWERAGVRVRAAELLGRAGRRAAARGGLSTAIELLERSLALAGNDPLAPVLEALFEALVAAGQVVRATELSVRLDAAATPEVRLTVHLGLARAAAAAGEWHVGRQELDQARRIAGAAGPAVTAPIDVVAAQLAFTDPTPGRLAEAEAMATRALVAAIREALPETACESLEVLGTCARVRDLDEAEALFGQALAIANQHGLALWRMRLLFHLGAHVGIRSGEPTRLVEARVAAAAAGALVTAVDIVAELAVVHLIRGEYGEAARYAQECEDTARRLRLGEMPLVALGLRICVSAHQGRRAEADDLLSTYERLGGSGAGITSAVWGFGLAFCSLLEEDRDRALADFDRAAAAEVNRPPQYVSYSHGPRLLLAVLEGKEGWDEYDAVRSSASGQARWNRLFLALVTAVLASREERPYAVVSQAVAEFRAHAEPFPLAHHLGLRLLGEVAVDGGWGEPAQWLRSAEAYFHAMPAPRIAAACRALLRRAGKSVGQRRRGTDAVPHELRVLGVTVREHEVLTLVAAKLTNREISDQLVVSRRTVDTHVSNLLAKTGQPNRSALARRYAECLGAVDARMILRTAVQEPR
jgi:DNA-binding CsgD family transcriptional regulator/tetratricopeptide (TPR) repeat protein